VALGRVAEFGEVFRVSGKRSQSTAAIGTPVFVITKTTFKIFLQIIPFLVGPNIGWDQAFIETCQSSGHYLQTVETGARSKHKKKHNLKYNDPHAKGRTTYRLP
jgi:hypothetical protein